MGGGVPSPSSGDRAVRICHYNRCLFLIHIQLARKFPFIPKAYALILPPSHGWWGSCLPLPHYHNVKKFPCRNVLVQTFVTVGNLPSNRPLPHVIQSFTNGGVPPFSVLAPKHAVRNTPRYPIMNPPQLLQNTGHYDSRIQYKNNDRLEKHHIEPPIGPGVIPLPPQQAGETYQFPPCSIEVPQKSARGHYSDIRTYNMNGNFMIIFFLVNSN